MIYFTVLMQPFTMNPDTMLLSSVLITEVSAGGGVLKCNREGRVLESFTVRDPDQDN